MNISKKNYSHLQEIIHRRRSIRRFSEKPVEREKVIQCLEAARQAPSAENVQPWRFLVIDDQKIKNEFADQVFSGVYYPSRFAKNAPVLILILAKLDILANRIGKQIQGVNYYLIDIGIAGEHLVLQAEELGLSSCWIGWFNQKKARKFFRIPKKFKLISLIALGYAAKRPRRPKERKTLKEIVWFNSLDNNKNESDFHSQESFESKTKSNRENEENN